MSAYIQLLNNLKQLELTKMIEILPAYMDSAVVENKSATDILNELAEAEINFREERARQINLTISHFPFLKTLDDFDFTYQPSINRNQIMDLASLRFIPENENILFIGSSGVGKTHLAVSIGMECASRHYSTYFIHFNDLMAKFKSAAKEGRIESVVKHYAKYKVLIIDEIGYLPIDKEDSNLFFQLIDMRYEKKSTILTTNMNFNEWDGIFYDAVVANAIMDRVLHHAHVIPISGKSYRLKDHIKQTD